MKTPIIIIYVTFDLDTRVGVKTVKYSTCTWYLYLSTYLSVLDVLGVWKCQSTCTCTSKFRLDQKVLFIKKCKRVNYLNTS